MKHGKTVTTLAPPRILPLALFLALTLSACAQQTDLEPKAGASLPPAPFGADHQPDANELLERATQAAPERNVELRTRSEEREVDPFDLPPEG